MSSYDVTVDPLKFLWGSTVWMMTCQMAHVYPQLLMQALITVNKFWIVVLAFWYGKPYTATKHIGPLYI